MDTVWVLGDQLNRRISSLEDRTPDDARILMIESAAKIGSKRYHRQRLHLVITAMRRFAAELEDAGFEVDYREAPSFAAGLDAHRADHNPDDVIAMEPMSYSMLERLGDLGVTTTRSNQFLCHYEEFAGWADGRNRLVMEDFYRRQREKLGYLMDGDEPAGGAWNFDKDNREPPPKDGRSWPEPVTSRLDELDAEVIEALPDSAFGWEPDGVWATSRRAALARLRHVVDEVLPIFGPHEDAMLSGEWSMGHTLLSPYLNLGLLYPDEVCDAAEEAYRAGRVPIASAEGFIRQIIGWREYVWGTYWLWMPEYRTVNQLGADRPLPPLYTSGSTDMRCVSEALRAVHEHGYAHHIQRLMVLGNLALLTGVVPQQMVEWMWASFVDGAEWVMLPNVLGMGLYADGGQMATKPYAAGGNYINKMSDYCGDCAFHPKKRVGSEACPFTTLYWDFLERNRSTLDGNHRLARQLSAADRLQDMGDVRDRAAEVLERLDGGEL
ncbi:MAG: cryptochrome/photolyase family protein [Acidimicrobiia bacterium]|nr:cryptochrome/photolyase family protein [Acidimicrobiia bacterium]NNF10154.1 cryptochrome/photolyase family protein [Acidimicrobiia bacterium]NNL69741.1 cryptochrome/photolyase family protein [Acidimicrobiia bacterium]